MEEKKTIVWAGFDVGKKHFLHHWIKSQNTGKQRLHRCRVAFSNGLRRDFQNFFSGSAASSPEGSCISSWKRPAVIHSNLPTGST